MCCLFGLLDYKNHFNQKQKNKIISILATACEARGTDATGIAYNHGGHLSVYKRPLAAHKMRFAVPDVPLIMGHTRMTTQGDEKRNYNNHPFSGNNFALAHNGVIYNDDSLRKTEKLPDTKIETDSYIAVQLIEKKGNLCFESLKFMAEKLIGSFTITVMDKDDNLYFVKGDNPMCIYHYPEIGVYIYASTEEILKKALKKMPYRFGTPYKIEIIQGDILKIDNSGNKQRSKFDTDLLDACNFYSRSPFRHINDDNKYRQEYIQQLKTHADFYGYTASFVDELLEDGYTTDDIEEIIYCGVF